MKTLYININGDNIQSTEDQIVIGKPDSAIINKFFYELAKEIVKGVTTPGIGDIKNKKIITEFQDYNIEKFNNVLAHWENVKRILLGVNPSGNCDITLPDEYVQWLKFRGSVYTEVATSLSKRGNAVKIGVDKIYTNAIGLLVNNIDTTVQYDHFVVNDNLVDDDSHISKDIRKKIGEDVPFVPYEVSTEKNQEKGSSEENGCANYFSTRVKLRKFPPELSIKEHDYIPSMNEGLIVVKNNNTQKIGYYNEQGIEVIPCSYCDAMPFYGGYAWVLKEQDSGWSIINTVGEVVNVVNEVSEIRRCNGGQLQLANDSCYYQDGRFLGRDSNNESYELSAAGVRYYRNGHSKLYKNEYDRNDMESTGDLVVKEEDGKYGVANRVSGSIYIPTEYSKIVYLGKYYYYLEKDSEEKFIIHIDI